MTFFNNVENVHNNEVSKLIKPLDIQNQKNIIQYFIFVFFKIRKKGEAGGTVFNILKKKYFASLRYKTNYHERDKKVTIREYFIY